MKRLRSILHWFELGDASTPAARALLVEQARNLKKWVPVLYASLIVNSISIAYMLPATLSRTLKFGLPGVWLFVISIHLISWLRLKPNLPTAEEAVRQLSRARGLAAGMNAGFLAWSVAVLDNIDIGLRAPVSLLDS